MRRAFALAARRDIDLVWPAALIAGVLAALASIDPMLHADRLVTGPDPWAAWQLDPGLTAATLAVAWLYVAGQPWHGTVREDRRAGLRHLAFFGGLAALFLALQSPIEPISDHLFVAHQVEHMLLRTAAPMLLMLAAPQAALIRGLPAPVRRRVVTPLLASRGVRALGVLGHPAVATILFVATTYFWMIPRFHDVAILNEGIHEIWHTTLLVSGLIFFWRILDARPYPLGASLGVRLFMFWFASMGNILLGSYLSFKGVVLYHAYDQMGRLWGLAPGTDEHYGGLTMWIPGSMMFAVTAMVMIYRWAQSEDRDVARPVQSGERVGAGEFLARRRAANRKMALGLVAFVATVAVITFSTVVIYHYAKTSPLAWF